jgi:hypothetical protein
MYYHESLFLDYIGSVPYSLDYNFDFDCQVMPWVTDRIRVNYFAGMKNKRILGKEIDSRDSTQKGREAEANNDKLPVVEGLNFS